MTWVLLIFMYGNTMQLSTFHFSSAVTCEAARNTIVKAMEDYIVRTNYVDRVAPVCVEEK